MDSVDRKYLVLYTSTPGVCIAEMCWIKCMVGFIIEDSQFIKECLFSFKYDKREYFPPVATHVSFLECIRCLEID